MLASSMHHARPSLALVPRAPASRASIVEHTAGLTLLASSGAAYALRSTPPGRLLSPPMLSFSMALALSNAGLLPAAHASYDLCTGTLLPVQRS